MKLSLYGSLGLLVPLIVSSISDNIFFYNSLITDLSFSAPILVDKPMNNPDDYQYLTPISNYGNNGRYQWILAQWMSDYPINPDVSNGYYYDENFDYISYSAGPNRNEVAKKISFSKHTQKLYMECNAQYEYDNCTNLKYSPYYNGEWWVHFLLEYKLHQDQSLYISELNELVMKMDYKIIKDDMYIDFWQNVSQFSWYITIQNRNVDSPDFDQYMWFGLTLYDNRNAGKGQPEYMSTEYGSNIFLFSASSVDYIPAVDKSIPNPGEERRVNYSILEVVKEKFYYAQSLGYFPNSSIEDMAVGAMNLGFEVIGGRNIAVEVDNFNLYYR